MQLLRSLAIFKRFSTAYPPNAKLSSLQGTFYAKNLSKKLTDSPLPVPQFTNDLPFGKYNSDHLITIKNSRSNGWSNPQLKPFEDLRIHPFTSSLHYGIQCFEGLKAYKNQKGQIRLFRPWCNALRLKRSSVRLTLPDFDGEELVKLIAQQVKTEQRWIPPRKEFSLYIRPIHIAMDKTLGVHSPDESQIIIMTGPVGAYYSKGVKPISLSCSTDSIRSAPLGTGAYKIGGNYGPTILSAKNVSTRKYDQILWLLGRQIVQVGSSNIFFIFKDKSGEIEIITPALEDLILPGVTRDSILHLLRDQKKYKVTERLITIDEVITRHKKGQLLECFGAGTAVIVGGVNKIEFEGIEYNIPVDEKLQIGRISHQIRSKLLDIQQGRLQDKYNWILRVK